jgi:hypothetical protein
MRSLITSLVAAAAMALPLTAQDAQMALKFGLVNTQGDARDMTQKAFGFTLEAGYVFTPDSWGGAVDFMPYLGLVKVSGNRDTHGREFTYNLRGNILGGDLIYKPWDNLPVRIFTGPCFTQYYIERLQSVSPQMGDRSFKIGWRLGASYEVQKNWQLGLAYTQTEWRSRADSDEPYEAGINPSRPAYVSLTATYRF